jgi:hypothetical protein
MVRRPTARRTSTHVCRSVRCGNLRTLQIGIVALGAPDHGGWETVSPDVSRNGGLGISSVDRQPRAGNAGQCRVELPPDGPRRYRLGEDGKVYRIDDPSEPGLTPLP